MMKFIALAAVVVAATTLVSAGSISIVECKDSECKLGCKAIGKQATGECHHRPFSHEGSYEAMCAPAPTARCIYGGMFKVNSTNPTESCTDANVEMLAIHECGKCVEHTHEKFKGKSMKIGCPTSAADNITISMGCNSDCSTCDHTSSMKEKSCNIIHKGIEMAVGFGAPLPCPGTIKTQHWNVSQTCSGAAAMGMSMFEKACYARGRGHSHYYVCSQ